MNHHGESRLHRVGISLKKPHVDALLALQPPLGFVVMSAPDLMDQGEEDAALLDRAASRYPVSLNAGAIFGEADPEAAEQQFGVMGRLAERVHAPWVAGHWEGLGTGSWTRVDTSLTRGHGEAALLALRLRQARETIGRPVLLEWPFSVAHEARPVAQAAVAQEACARAGCKLLLDVNRLLMAGIRRAWRSEGLAPWDDVADRSALLRRGCAMALEAMWEVSADSVAHVRLAGFRWPSKEAVVPMPEAPREAATAGMEPLASLAGEDRSQRISESAWEVFEHALVHLDQINTSIQWDTDLPPLAVLLDEARLAAEAIERSEREGPPDDEA